MSTRKLVSFDWALKRLLRSKANFEVLEGFLSELLKDDISIIEVLESESNQDAKYDKYNRVDLKVRDKRGDLLIIEIQYDPELDYLQRILYSTAKAIVEHMELGNPYKDVTKVISVNILYFNLGSGQDYVYHGRTEFIGIHHHDQLQLNTAQKQAFSKTAPFELFPEYYLIKINQFDNIARDPLDEWIYLLKNAEVKDGSTARGLTKAKEVLDMLKLSDAERKQYAAHQENLSYQASMEFSFYSLGEEAGIKKGLEQGLEKGKLTVAQNLLPLLDDAAIAAVTGLDQQTIHNLRSQQ